MCVIADSFLTELMKFVVNLLACVIVTLVNFYIKMLLGANGLQHCGNEAAVKVMSHLRFLI